MRLLSIFLALLVGAVLGVAVGYGLEALWHRGLPFGEWLLEHPQLNAAPSFAWAVAGGMAGALLCIRYGRKDKPNA